jgi:hypothetical protein
MGAAKVIFATQDRSAVIKGLSGIYTGIVGRFKKGPVNKPIFIGSGETKLIEKFGTPDLRYPETNSAVFLSQATNKLWVVRAAAPDVKYSGVLVRGGNFEIGDKYSDNVKRVVEPLDAGLTQEDFDSFLFIQEPGKIQIEKELDQAAASYINTYEFCLGGAPKNIEAGQKIVISSNPNYAPLTDYDVEKEGFQVIDVFDVYEKSPFQRIVFDKDADGNQTTLTVKKGDVVKNKSNGATAVVLTDVNDSPYIIVDSADLFHDGDTIVKLNPDGTESDDTAIQKFKDQVSLWFVKTKQPVTISSSDTIYKVTKVSNWNQMFTFLVTGINPGEWNNALEIGIEKNSDYPDMKCFDLVVYENGVEVERWLVSKDPEFVDGFGKKRYIETVINGNSNYIQVKDNVLAKTIDGQPLNPKSTDYSIWRRKEEKIFGAAKDENGERIQTKEDVFVGDIELYVTGLNGLNIGDTIKLIPNFETEDQLYGSEYYEEYTIENINADNNQIFLDRPIQRNYEYDDANEIGWYIYKFQRNLTDLDKHILEGKQYFPYTILSYSLISEHIGDTLAIGDKIGKVLDAGVNFMFGGDNGSPVSLADMISALRTLSNNNKTPVQSLVDGGYTVPAYAQEMLKVAMAQGENNTHCYWSMDPAAEESANPLNAVKEYAEKLMINTHLGSLFTGWVKEYDPYNKEYVWVAPSVFGAITQNFVHRNYTLFTPAAGLVRGKVLGLDIKHQFSDSELDLVVDAKINPIVYKEGEGLIIWGNRTMYSKPSPLQLRSVAFLLMVIRYGLESYLKYELFNYNNPETWARIKSAIDSFMSNEIQAKDGVYAYQCVVNPTDFDIDNRRLPIFLGIQPTMDINEIKVTLAVFNRSLAITV